MAARWKPDTTKYLILMWEKEGLESGEIAAILKVTRSAVLGKLFRLGRLNDRRKAQVILRRRRAALAAAPSPRSEP